jgi:hypothetical protein
MGRRDAIVVAALIALVLAAGCASGPSAARHASTGSDLDIAVDLAENSASAARMIRDGVQRLVVREDGADDDYIYLSLMEDHDTHACRLETLRMRRTDHRLERQTYDADGEFLWVSEPPAVRAAMNSSSQLANAPHTPSAAATLGP